MLHLAGATPSSWVERAVSAIDEVLLDHAHLEKKAAATAINLIFRYPDHPSLMVPLSAIAREELEHFELVIEQILQRGLTYRRMKPSAYAGRLLEVVRKDEPQRLLDTLLCCAFIEARSCERMRLLAGALGSEPKLAELYEGLLASEARHHRTYIEMAETAFDPEEVALRLDEIARHEANVIATAWPENRLHG